MPIDRDDEKPEDGESFRFKINWKVMNHFARWHNKTFPKALPIPLIPEDDDAD